MLNAFAIKRICPSNSNGSEKLKQNIWFHWNCLFMHIRNDLIMAQTGKQKNYKGIYFDLREDQRLKQFCFLLSVLWPSNLLHRVQKPDTSYATKHVCNSAWCKRHSNVHTLYAFYSRYSISRPLDVWWEVFRFYDFGALTFGMVSMGTMGLIAVSRYFCVVKNQKSILSCLTTTKTTTTTT